MRKVLRDADSLTYWDRRWSAFEADDDEFVNMDIYPVKYVDPIMNDNSKTLEAGCGLGRVVKHYHKRGFDIIGCDFSSVAVKKLNKSNPDIAIIEANIASLPYENEEFDNILTLGVFHSIEDLAVIDKGITECVRCLKPGGSLVASVRADNLENKLIDKITELRGHKGTSFHKWCFKEVEFKELLEKHSFSVKKSELITNVPFLNKFRLFQKVSGINEGDARSQGFQLNGFGRCIYGSLKFLFPNSFGTTLVFTASKQLG